jgi:hypothetical protein
MDLQLKDNRRLDVASVDELDPDDLSAWIRARLHDEDTLVPDDPKQDVGQYYLVGAIYEDLAPSTQADVRRILTRFLRQLEEGDDDWEGRPADTLLLLVKNIGETEEDEKLAGPIRRMARHEHVLGEDPDWDMHARLLQTLIFLGEKMPPEFWMRQLQLNASRFGVLAFAGMRMHSLDQALGRVLPELNLEHEELRIKLKTELRGLLAVDRYSHEDLREIIADARKHEHISDEAYRMIREALPEVGLADMETNGLGKARDYFDRQGELTSESLAYAGA